MNRVPTTCFVLTLATALVACASATNPEQNQASPELAARYNAQLAAAYMQEGHMNMARSKLAEALRLAPHLTVVHNTLALYYIRLGQYDKAEEQYKLSLRNKPDDPETLNNYGVFLCSQDKPRASLQYFLRAADNLDYATPDSALANAGLCAQKIPDNKLAMKYFLRTLAINPDQAQALWQLGLMAFEQGRYSEADKHFRHLIAIRSKPSARLLWVGLETAWIIGQRQRARRYGRQLMKLYPDSAETGKFIELLGHAKQEPTAK